MVTSCTLSQHERFGTVAPAGWARRMGPPASGHRPEPLARRPPRIQTDPPQMRPRRRAFELPVPVRVLRVLGPGEPEQRVAVPFLIFHRFYVHISGRISAVARIAQSNSTKAETSSRLGCSAEKWRWSSLFQFHQMKSRGRPSDMKVPSPFISGPSKLSVQSENGKGKTCLLDRSMRLARFDLSRFRVDIMRPYSIRSAPKCGIRASRFSEVAA